MHFDDGKNLVKLNEKKCKKQLFFVKNIHILKWICYNVYNTEPERALYIMLD